MNNVACSPKVSNQPNHDATIEVALNRFLELRKMFPSNVPTVNNFICYQVENDTGVAIKELLNHTNVISNLIKETLNGVDSNVKTTNSYDTKIIRNEVSDKRKNLQVKFAKKQAKREEKNGKVNLTISFADKNTKATNTTKSGAKGRGAHIYKGDYKKRNMTKGRTLENKQRERGYWEFVAKLYMAHDIEILPYSENKHRKDLADKNMMHIHAAANKHPEEAKDEKKMWIITNPKDVIGDELKEFNENHLISLFNWIFKDISGTKLIGVAKKFKPVK